MRKVISFMICFMFLFFSFHTAFAQDNAQPDLQIEHSSPSESVTPNDSPRTSAGQIPSESPSASASTVPSDIPSTNASPIPSESPSPNESQSESPAPSINTSPEPSTSANINEEASPSQSPSASAILDTASNAIALNTAAPSINTLEFYTTSSVEEDFEYDIYTTGPIGSTQCPLCGIQGQATSYTVSPDGLFRTATMKCTNPNCPYHNDPYYWNVVYVQRDACMVTKYDGNDTDVTVPDILGGHAVTIIGDSAFINKTNITSVVLPSTIDTIENSAFSGCTSLKNLLFTGYAPDYIGSNVFYHHNSNFTIFYYPQFSGWSTPTWNGYPCYPTNIGELTDFVTRFYKLFLSRDPDPTGLNNWVSALQTGQLSGADTAKGFVFSDEFKSQNLSNSDFATIMYNAFFGRGPDPSGLSAWTNILDQGFSRYYVMAGFVNSDEFKAICTSYGIKVGSLQMTDPADKYPNTTSFVARFYELCLGRGGDPTGLNNWVGALQSGQDSGSDVAYGFVFSNEFISRNVSNADFVTIMYKAFFNRDPDPSGYNAWLNLLNSGTSRLHVLAGFVGSQEFISLCSSYGIKPGYLKS